MEESNNNLRQNTGTETEDLERRRPVCVTNHNEKMRTFCFTPSNTGTRLPHPGGGLAVEAKRIIWLPGLDAG